jgi:maltose alpha-D-glucosyltransferase/alpha-amylase
MVQPVSVQDPGTFLDWDNRVPLGQLLTTHTRNSDIGRPRQVTAGEVIDLQRFDDRSCLVVLRVSFTAGDAELRLLPLTIEIAAPDPARSGMMVAELRLQSGQPATMYADAPGGALSDAILRLISRGATAPMRTGVIRGIRYASFPSGDGDPAVCLLPSAPSDAQRNTSVLLSRLYALKLFLRLEQGPNPEVETARYLFEEAGYSHLAPVMGSVEYVSPEGHSYSAGVLHAFVENRTDLWRLMLEELALFLERMPSSSAAPGAIDKRMETMRTSLELARLLGKRTGELHRALIGPVGSGFEPEPLDHFYCRGAYHAMTARADMVRSMLEAAASGLPASLRAEISSSLGTLAKAGTVFGALTRLSETGSRIRIHGDLHLGQVLYSGDDVVFIDFEGDNSRPVFERRIKSSPLVDVAGMTNSFRYAAMSANYHAMAGVLAWRGRGQELRAWTSAWSRRATEAYLESYRQAVASRGLVPKEFSEFYELHHIYALEKAIYQLGYELEHRPDWVPVALSTLTEISSERP